MQAVMLDQPRVTVVMPVFNGDRYLHDAMKSILGQTLTDFEFLLIDDGSFDNSAAIISSFNDSRIRLVKNERNMGLPYTRNRGIELAAGSYIAFLDCDDIAEPTRLEKQVAFLEANPDFGLVGSWVRIIDANGRTTGEVWRHDYKPEEIPAILLFHNCLVQSAVTLRRSAIPGGGYDRNFAYSEDYELWGRMAEGVRICNYPETLNRYRLSRDSTSRQHAADMLRYHQMVTRKLLARLGIDASDDEMEIHRLVAARNMTGRPDLIADADRWLQRLLDANTFSGRYRQQDFRNVVTKMWLGLCQSAATQGEHVTFRFLLSPLSRQVDFRTRTAFVLRALRSIPGLRRTR